MPTAAYPSPSHPQRTISQPRQAGQAARLFDVRNLLFIPVRHELQHDAHGHLHGHGADAGVDALQRADALLNGLAVEIGGVGVLVAAVRTAA